MEVLNCISEIHVFMILMENIIMEKSSRAQSGWKFDSLIRSDSSVYTSGKMSERYYRQYNVEEVNCGTVDFSHLISFS